MGKILISIIAVSFLITGCRSVDVYTFKKDRVDQTVEGNKGYLKGTAPELQAKANSPQRTMIGVDIELPGPCAQTEKSEARFKKGEAIPECPTKAEADDANIPRPKKQTQDRVDEKKKPETVVVETIEVETEEEWIK
ncbi:MAG: hypothetical protein KJ995_00435 [Candidatus Omnitrophica bacterium]|nr:hypothetical protein [Candidatus Omnitrophota bacterium]MBU1128176.1 hypothetical protein [Candidatus Omnitrophota bacterium]MBU1785200.1 hypothetical protein [Candidatus Omnitrophota bacterium]MBU1850860.1 hypothetical protein [Candidatus Omnitrophota bacterium]